MDYRKFILIGVLLMIFDRIEYAYYLIPDGQEALRIPFLIKGNPIRFDAYVFDMSIRLQQIILGIILFIIYRVKATKFLIVAFVLSFLEFPLTYNQPFFTIPLPFGWFIPVSAATARLMAVIYFMYVGAKMFFDSNDWRNFFKEKNL